VVNARRFRLGPGLLLVAAAALGVVLWVSTVRLTRGLDRALAQEFVIHHFERSSWFAMNAGKYEAVDPDLAREFRESAVWHARRAREFQRMDAGEAVREAERDNEHDLADGRLRERELKLDPLLSKGDQVTGRPGPDEAEARAAPP
jgi:hypothetical protein